MDDPIKSATAPDSRTDFDIAAELKDLGNILVQIGMDVDVLMRILKKKGLVTEDEIAAMLQEVVAEAKEAAAKIHVASRQGTPGPPQ